MAIAAGSRCKLGHRNRIARAGYGTGIGSALPWAETLLWEGLHGEQMANGVCKAQPSSAEWLPGRTGLFGAAKAITSTFLPLATSVAEAEAHIPTAKQRFWRTAIKMWTDIYTLSEMNPLHRTTAKTGRVRKPTGRLFSKWPRL
ncbi:zinc knuckle [Colletotrichum higginsianum IMI 349063]|uniref:Zinc knuckle n=1 Tax=Colletotrichum higginsianum (strain IMI 349063) TaxID=759273 RepID=A0A1B7XQD4_COLHI|nr:zinc knuckle [Colletotrichum higginsianum IMI 349063]OBR01967.1 zinc knuckle [Colletotrichum higginsianum IMI 349063]